MVSFTASTASNVLPLAALKRPRAISCLVACAIAAITAATAAGAGLETWAQSYGSQSYGADGTRDSVNYEYGSGFDWVQGIAAMPDGGYVVAGQIDLPERYAGTSGNHTGGYSDAALVRYAADGKILWQQQIRQTNDATNGGVYVPAPSRVFKMLADGQGNIFICGGKGNTNNGGYLPFVAKFAPNGALAWQNGIGAVLVPGGSGVVDGGIAPFTSMDLTRDGGVIVGMYEGRAMSNSHQVPAIAKFNSDGSLGFHAAYEHAKQYDSTYAVAASRTDSSSYLWVTWNPISSSNVGITATRVGANGAVTAERSFSREGRYETPIAAIGTNDGGFVILSQQGALSNGVSSGNFGFVVRKLNAGLKPVFEKFVQRANQDRFRIDGIAAAADGGFVISGTTSATEPGTPGATGTEAAIVKLNASGDLQFVSLLGGPNNEGSTQSQGQPYVTSYAVAGKDGGYGLATASFSYLANPELDNSKADWWTVKTDNARKVKNFDGVMVDLPLSKFSVAENINPGEATTRFSRIASDAAQPILSKEPGFTLEDLAKKEGINKPDVIFQGSSSPRIISSDTAEAVIGEHFSYHIVAAFVSPDATLTYSAAGLPAGFVLDPQTGVISGAPKPGSATTSPILITLRVNDGPQFGTAVLALTIGRGTQYFTVNDSAEPAYPGANPAVTGLADQPLSFATDYPGAAAGQFVGVQSSTSPGVANSWTDLNTGTDGYMTYDVATARYVLNSINYPAQSAVYFRAIVKTPGKPDAPSNVVGPFNLQSSTPRVGKTLFQLIRNGRRADFDFRATLISPRSDVVVRVESTRTPSDEQSWSDISGGQMTNEPDTKQFSGRVDSFPPGAGVYFRAVGRSAGAADSLSNIVGPYIVEPHTPPSVSTVTLDPPATGAGGSSLSNPAVITAGVSGTAKFRARVDATSSSGIAGLRVLLDGKVVQTVSATTATASLDVAIGDHVIEGVAVDKIGVTTRAGTNPLYVRVVPSNQAAAMGASTSGPQAAQPRREVYTVATSGGRWDNPATWQNQSGAPGVPGNADFVVLGGSTVKLGAVQQVFSLTMDGGSLIGPGGGVLTNLQVVNQLTIGPAGGSFDVSVNLLLQRGAVMTTLNSANVRMDGVIVNQGTLDIHGDRGVVGLSNLLNTGAVNFHPSLTTPAQVAAGLPLSPRVISTAVFDNLGTVSVLPSAGAPLVSGGAGNVISRDGAGIVAGGAGNILANDGASLIGQDGAGLIGQDGAGVIGQDGAGLIGQDGAGIVAGGAGNIVDPSGAATNAPAAATASGFVQNGGETDLTGLFIRGPVTLNGGVLSGTGLIAGGLTNEAGYVSPGTSPGSLTVSGKYIQKADATLVIEAAGGEAGQFDQLLLGGAATLGGNLVVKTLDGYVALPGDPFSPLGYKSVSGSFASVSGNVQVTKNSTGLLTTLKPDAPNPPAPKLLNISTRMRVEAGENALIGGFIVTGTEPKKVLIRALGPTLPVSDPLLDPTLELNGPGVKISNNDWKETQAAAITATGVAPENDREAAIIATLQPGQGYTAIVRGNGATVGVGLVEVYDLNSGASSELANISTRGVVQTGENVMIGGFIIGGNTPAKVLVRALGPSLGEQGVAQPLLDPELQVVDAHGSSLTNDDWHNTQEAEIAATGVPPTKDRESALVATLVPGAYTAIVRGKGETTGVALVEAFNLH